PPPRRTERADFPHSALLLASRQGLCDLPPRQRFRRRQAPPTPPGPPGSAFPWAYIPPLRSCRSMGAFLRAPLPPVLPEESRTAGPLRSAGITPFRRYYGPLRHPLAVSRLPGATGYTAYPASAVSGRDEEGFSSSSMCPGPLAVANRPAGAVRRINRAATGRAAFALQLRARPPGLRTFGATSRSLALRPGDSHSPQG